MSIRHLEDKKGGESMRTFPHSGRSVKAGNNWHYYYNAMTLLYKAKIYIHGGIHTYGSYDLI